MVAAGLVAVVVSLLLLGVLIQQSARESEQSAVDQRAGVVAQNISTLPLHVRGHGYSPATYGVILSLNGVIVVLFELPVVAWIVTYRACRARL